MATEIINVKYSGDVRLESDFSELERYVLLKVHPRRLLIDSCAWMWAVYLLWNHQWQGALIAVALSEVAGYFMVRKVSVERMNQTLLGKIALLHMHPINLSLQVLGAFGVGYALWNHSALGILSGLTAIILGHLWGWAQVENL